MHKRVAAAASTVQRSSASSVPWVVVLISQYKGACVSAMEPRSRRVELPVKKDDMPIALLMGAPIKPSLEGFVSSMAPRSNAVLITVVIIKP